MTTGQPDEKSIFTIARAIDSAPSREMYLNQVCGGDPALRQRVEALLQVHDSQRCLLKSVAPAVALTLDLSVPLELPGTRIGPYKLLEQIGEGGMGIVYVASQKEPLRRKVALKIIKPGMDTREVVARFEAERQALALMDHPNIAKVFDAGATDAGRPYFAMELVKGTPITTYCDREQLSTHERLELFVTLCHGVQHAHQKGVIHRDLKPSNLLVEVHDVRPVPKIIDFGIAKAVGQHLTEKTFYTAQSQMVGTPLYMSPEQAGQSNKDVDTRSDIYSLGVLLYELLTGHTPFEKDALRTAGFDEMRRIIREVDPPRPSVRVSTLQAADLSTVCDQRSAEPRKLSKQLRGDLDWIVMKAMDKDRDRRYATANDLAADVQRYLDDEPIQARRPTLAHHAAKWVRRHRPLVWSAAVVLTMTALASGALFWTSYRRAAQLERDAGEHLAAATAFLDSGNYIAADREWADVRGHLESAGYRKGPLQEKMAELALPIAAVKRFDEFQATRHRIHSEMYALDRDILDQAQMHCRAALDLIGVFEDKPWKSQAAFQILNTERQAMLDEGAVELLFIWSRLEIGKSDSLPASDRTAGYYRAIKALGKIENFHPPIPAVVLWIADCCEAIGDQQASAEARTRAESLKPTSATDHYLLGEYHAQHGRQEQALASYWQALARQPDHYLSLLGAGVALGELKEYKSAEAMLTGAIAMDPQTVLGYVKRGASRLGQGRILLAQADFQQAKKLDPELARALSRRAWDYLKNHDLDKALADFNEAIRLDPESSWAFVGRAQFYSWNGDWDKAFADCNEAIRLDPKDARAYAGRAAIHNIKGDCDKTLADCNEAIRLDPNDSWAYFERGIAYADKGDSDKALADYNEVIRLDPKNGNPYAQRGCLYLDMREFEKAAAELDRAAELAPIGYHYYKRRAAAHFELQHYAKTLESIAKAVELNADDTSSSLLWIPPARVAKCPDERLRQGLLELADKAIEKSGGNAGVYAARGVLRLAFGHQEKALPDFRRAVELKSDDVFVWYQCAVGQLAAGRPDGYRQDCGAMLQRFGQTNKASDGHLTAWACVLAPDATTDWATAVALAEKTVQSDPKSATYLNTLGAVLYRAGRFDEALTRLAEAAPLVQEPSEAIKSPPAYTWFFLAMVQHRLGHAEEVKPWLDKAVAWTDKSFAEADQGTADLSWNRRLTLKLLRNEATALLGVTPPTVEPSPAPAAKVEEAKESSKTTPVPEPAKEEEKPQ